MREDAGITLARFAAGLRFEVLADEVVAKVKELVLDSFGVALAGSTAPGVDALARAVRRWGGATESTLYAHGVRVPSLFAALANGVMSTARDFDDTLDSGMLHTQPSVLPAVLAVGEAEGGRSGRELIAAVAAGAEVLCRIGLARRRGQEFLPTGTAAGMAAAAAAARMLGLPFEGVLDSCGIAYSQCAANVQPLREGATVKRFHAGFAAKVGVLSATLARNGITGAHHWLEGEFGYLNLYERGEYVREPLTAGLGERYELLGLSLKPYPSARDNHGAIEAALSLTLEHDLRPEQVERVTVLLPPNAFGISGKPFGQATGHPVVEAIVSAAYAVGVAIVRRRVALDDFSEAAVADPRVRAVAERVRVELYPGVTDPVTFVPQTVAIRLHDGRVLERTVDVLKGHPYRPLTREEVLAKFRSCCHFAARPVSEDRASAIVAAVEGLDALDDVRALGDLLAL